MPLGQNSLAVLGPKLLGLVGGGTAVRGRVFSFLLSAKKEEFLDFPPGEG